MGYFFVCFAITFIDSCFVSTITVIMGKYKGFICKRALFLAKVNFEGLIFRLILPH